MRNCANNLSDLPGFVLVYSVFSPMLKHCSRFDIALTGQ